MKINFALAALLLAPSAQGSPTLGERHAGITTTSGIVIGHPASNKTGVTEFLGIPYAASTEGSQRWLPPKRFISKKPFDASTYGPSCPVNNPPGSPPFPGKTPQFDRIFLAFTTQGGNVMSEDCLSANIWVKSTSKKPKAVMLFIHGGRWDQAAAKSPFYNGQYLADAEDVIVVTINYRLNVFGFPGTPGLQQNLGLLDQRMALEWVRDNIARFGGDIGRIILFGESAGSVSVGYQAYISPKDPIAGGYIMESGTPHTFTPLTPSLAAQHWYNASSILGCGASGNVLPCMRAQNMTALLAAYAQVPYDPTKALLEPQFQPVADNITVFPDYSALSAAGKFAKKPLLVGNNDFESGFYQTLAFATGQTFTDTQQAAFNLEGFTCASAIDAADRVAQGVPVYRYRYYGDFANLRLFFGSGAYHGSELNIVFGTAQDVSGLPNDDVESKTIAYIQNAWATFARNPATGLVKLGWPLYRNGTAPTLIRLAYNNETTASFVAPSVTDSQCPADRDNSLAKGAM